MFLTKKLFEYNFWSYMMFAFFISAINIKSSEYSELQMNHNGLSDLWKKSL
jgi:hypothetical protein